MMTPSALIADLRRQVGSGNVLTEAAHTARYRKGFRSGEGDALAVVFPATLLELFPAMLPTSASPSVTRATVSVRTRW